MDRMGWRISEHLRRNQSATDPDSSGHFSFNSIGKMEALNSDLELCVTFHTATQTLPTTLSNGWELGITIPLVRRHRYRRGDQRRGDLLDSTAPLGDRVFSDKDDVIRAQLKPGG